MFVDSEQVGQTKPLLKVEDRNASGTSNSAAVLTRGGLLLAAIALVGAASLLVASLLDRKYPGSAMLSHSGLAFVLGLRHAVDCDHLAAIDNVTRQFLSRGETPISVGFWFALGHSAVVVVITAAVAGGYSMMLHASTSLMEDMAAVAGFLSVTLLAGIGLLNARIAVELFVVWMGQGSESSDDERVKAADGHAHATFHTALSGFSFLSGVFNRVDRPYKMFGAGLLFGLSFDTATQVGLIGMAAISGTSGKLPPALVLLFPLCFSSGMCLVDSGNGLLMLATYSWAKVRPSQKVFYNFLVTSMSAIIALCIGSLELLQVVCRMADLHGPFWDAVSGVDMAAIGYGIVGTFVVVFVAAVCFSCMRPDVPPSSALPAPRYS
jgi:high-affinity nickel-transport protein